MDRRAWRADAETGRRLSQSPAFADGALTARRPLASAQWALLLIAAAALLRLFLGGMTGLGIDESYVVAAGRDFRVGYFDHPPAVWWLAAAAAKIFGTDAPLVVRLPFIALFAFTTWLMFCLGRAIHGPRAGLWAAVALNLAPVFAVTTGSWVLPDGPLMAALLGAALCLLRALPMAPGGRAWAWWAGAGLCAGLALFSKYSAILSIGGVFVYLLTQPAQRRWLARPEPYVAMLLALAVFAPVLVWNAMHGWASLAFQGGRTGAIRFRPLAPLTALAGQALFVAPWIWLPLMISLITTLRRGPDQWRGWLLAWLALPAIAAFTLVAAVSDRAVLYHWAAPGYLLAFPLLGVGIETQLQTMYRRTRAWLVGSALFIAIGVALVATQVQFNWLPSFNARESMAMDAVDWTTLEQQWRARRQANGPDIALAGTNWLDTGKIDYALRGEATVICLCVDARQYALNTPLATFIGRDILVVVRQPREGRVLQDLRPVFESLAVLAPVTLRHGGAPSTELSLILGHRLLAWPPP